MHAFFSKNVDLMARLQIGTHIYITFLIFDKNEQTQWTVISRKFIIYNSVIPVPPLAEQQAISSELDDKITGVNLAEESIQQELETIEAMPAALLRKAFSGEL